MNNHRHRFVWSGAGFWCCDCGLGPTDEQLRELETSQDVPYARDLAQKLYERIDSLQSDLEKARAEIELLTKQNNRLIKDFAGRESVDCACSWDKDHDDVTGLCMAHEQFVEKRAESERDSLRASLAAMEGENSRYKSALSGFLNASADGDTAMLVRRIQALKEIARHALFGETHGK